MTTPGPTGQSESGAEFRQKFENLQAERDQLVLVSRNLAASAYQYVRPEDFEGVDPAKYVEHAAKVHEVRKTEREALFAEIAAEKGVDVTALSGGSTTTTTDSVASRIASLGELSGKPPAGPDLTEGLTGRAALEAIYAAEMAGQS